MPADNFDHLPQHVEEFCDLFPPSARLCRIINRRSGTLLDVRPNLDVVNDEVPRVVGNPESAGVQYWLITPYGDGQAIVPIPKDGSMKVRYLTPSTNFYGKSVTVSPFPTTWIIMPSSDCPKISALSAYSSPPTMYESWTCYISWPREGRMLDLWAGDTKPDTSVVIYPFEHLKQWQFWLIQFMKLPSESAILPILPSDASSQPGHIAIKSANVSLRNIY